MNLDTALMLANDDTHMDADKEGNDILFVGGEGLVLQTDDEKSLGKYILQMITTLGKAVEAQQVLLNLYTKEAGNDK